MKTKPVMAEAYTYVHLLPTFIRPRNTYEYTGTSSRDRLSFYAKIQISFGTVYASVAICFYYSGCPHECCTCPGWSTQDVPGHFPQPGRRAAVSASSGQVQRRQSHLWSADSNMSASTDQVQRRQSRVRSADSKNSCVCQLWLGTKTTVTCQISLFQEQLCLPAQASNTKTTVASLISWFQEQQCLPAQARYIQRRQLHGRSAG